MRKTASEAFKEVYGNDRNLMTPSIIRYGMRGDYAYEISKGEGINHEPMYGVTVLKWSWDDNKWERCRELSQCFPSLKEANAHIKRL